MKEKDFDVNNSNKLIVGISILFCTVILIIGVTTAYFTQGAGANIENIVTADQLSLEYNDDVNNYMRQELIPSTRDNAITAYNRTEEGKKCLDMNDYSACSIYRFSVKNTGDVSQSLIMTLNPTANSYTNLKFMLYEITEEGNNLIQDTTDLVKGSTESINLYKSYVLNPNKTNTYELVFYIEAQNYDQTLEDSGRQFGAGIRIDSITTGKYVAKNFGANCWNADAGETKTLTNFYGINHDTGEIDEMCNGYVSQDENGYYSINIPSSVGGQEITSIGNNLFNAASEFDPDEGPTSFNKYLNIKNITIENGIKEIKDGDMSNFYGSFMFIGMGISDSNYEFSVTLPNTLNKIGTLSFTFTPLKNILISKTVESIGDYAFFTNDSSSSLLSDITFDGALDGTSQLKTIGSNAFGGCTIGSLTIPSNVETIGAEAFSYNKSLTTLTFGGALEDESMLKTIGDYAFDGCAIESLTIPSNVETIGAEAFSSNKSLTTLTFVGALDGTSKLHTVKEEAFAYCDLTYTKKENPLILPPSITAMGSVVFSDSLNLKFIYFKGSTSGFDSAWLNKTSAEIVTTLPEGNE